MLGFGVLGYSQDIATNLEDTFDIKTNGEFDKITSHSPIIGWAYDGNQYLYIFWLLRS